MPACTAAERNHRMDGRTPERAGKGEPCRVIGFLLFIRRRTCRRNLPVPSRRSTHTDARLGAWSPPRQRAAALGSMKRSELRRR